MEFITDHLASQKFLDSLLQISQPQHEDIQKQYLALFELFLVYLQEAREEVPSITCENLCLGNFQERSSDMERPHEFLLQCY